MTITPSPIRTPWRAADAVVIALEIALVAAAVHAGALIAENVRLIPRALLHLPVITVSPEDVRTTATVTMAWCLVCAVMSRWVIGSHALTTARRTAQEIFALQTGFIAAALHLFLLTTVTFSPELLLAAVLVCYGGLAIATGVAALRSGQNAVGQFLRVFGNVVLLLRRPLPWLAVLFSVSPIVVAWLFTADRDFANQVTRLRVAVNLGDDYRYRVVNALGDQTFLTPIMMQFPPDDAGTLYVLTRSGQLWRVGYPDGAAPPELQVDLAADVGMVEFENGALGFDLHPEFGRAGSPNAGFAYVYYTQYRADGQTNFLKRFDLSAADPQARLASGVDLIAQSRNNDGYHNAGSVEFGPDGFLYVAVGEASMADCHQRVDCALVGGVLRIDVDRRGEPFSRPIARQPRNGRTAEYFIPLDNPYAGQDDALGEFWAHGLRNPFRISFDPATGALWAGDVGSTVWEEVNRIVAGGNYQYPYIEGVERTERIERPDPLTGTEQVPVLHYRHTAFLRSVIGGTVYRGAVLAELAGQYVFADNYSGEIIAIAADAPEGSTAMDVVGRVPEVAQRGITALVQAPDGQLLVSLMGDNDRPTGIIGRLVRADSQEAQAAGRAAADAAAARAAAGDGSSDITDDAARGLFNIHCARCHGAQGHGDGPDREALGVHIPDFASAGFQRWRSDDEIAVAIREGGPAVGASPLMPPWQGVLAEPEVGALVRYVRSLGEP